MPKTHTPTKACPHRWCRPAHRIASVEGGLAILALSIKQPWYLLIILVLAVLTTALYAATARKTLADIGLDELAPIIPLTVRHSWANTAVAIDIAMALLAPLAIAAAAMSKPGTYAVGLAEGGLIPIVVTVAFGLFHRLAHYFATRPAKPKRVLAPVPN